MSELELFNELKAQVVDMVQPVLSVKVSDDLTKNGALDTGKRIKSLEKAVEERRKELVAPLNARVKMINDYAKKVSGPLLDAEKHLKSQLIAYENVLAEQRREQERKLREAEALERKRIEEAAAKERAAADMFGIEVDESAIEIKKAEAAMNTAIAQKTIESQRVSGTRKVWSFEVVDSNAVPRQFLVVDESAIRKAVQAGERDIAGVRIFEETKMAFRG